MYVTKITMKKSKPTKSNDPAKILKMISRDEELERNDGKWVSKDRPHKNKKKYDRKRDKKGDLDSFFFKPGDQVEFIDKNPGSTGLSHESIYTVEDFCEMKDSELNWIPAVIYSCGDNVYVRAEESFNKKFKLYEGK